MDLDALLQSRSFWRFTAALLSLISLILLAILLTRRSSLGWNPSAYSGRVHGPSLAGSSLSVVLNGIIVAWVRWQTSRWHPGFDVAADLLAWLLNWGGAILLLIYCTVISDTLAEMAGYCDPVSGTRQEACAEEKRMLGMQFASGFFTACVGFVHLIFFIKACVETHRRHKPAQQAKDNELGVVRRGSSESEPLPVYPGTPRDNGA